MTKTKNKNPRASSRKGITARSHSWVLALIIVLIIIAVVAVIIFVIKPYSENNPILPVADNSQEQSPKPDTTNPDPADNTPEEPENKAPQYEGEDPNDLEELTGVIVSKSIDNRVLTIIATINQYLSQPGTCVVNLTGRSSHDSYTTSSNALADITTSYCENFEIPVSNLASDVYDIEIKLTGDGKTGTIRDEVSL